MKAGGGAAPDSDSDDEEAQRKKKEQEEEETTKVEKPRVYEFPHPRFNAALTVQADTLYIFGGTFEKGDREFTFDELWSINLNHLDGVTEIFKRELEDWQGSDDEADSEDEDDDEEDYSDDEDHEEEDGKSSLASPISTAPSTPSAFPSKDAAPAEEDIGTTEEISALTDTLPHPRPFESLRDFYARTSEAWQTLTIDELAKSNKGAEKSPKEIKKLAFERSEEKWWDCREEIRALEDEQEAAGIGEVVSLADRADAGAGAGPGRRR
jgi:hypothetical protein